MPKLAAEHGIHLGQVLSGTVFESFLDRLRQNSRLKQYQVEQYLQAIDDGWIMRKARYYRGAYQAEGEAAWSVEFLTWLVGQDPLLRSQYLLCRQILRDLPIRGDDDTGKRIRAVSTSVATDYPAFVDLKNKIHGRPDAGDGVRIGEFRRAHEGKVPAAVDSMLQDLERSIARAYEGISPARLAAYVPRLPPDHAVTAALRSLTAMAAVDVRRQSAAIAELLWRIRTTIPDQRASATRLAMLELSLDLEDMLFRLTGDWRPASVSELLEKNYILARGAAGAGYLEIWEWQTLDRVLSPPTLKMTISPRRFSDIVDRSRRAVSWGAAKVIAVYGPTAELFSGFEPLARSFTDDLVRGTLLLPWGEVTCKLHEMNVRLTGLANEVMGLAQQGQASGLNPGFALGELQVVRGPAEGIEFSDRKIYLLERAPADLKPVAGIATVSEGNAVSHVQLLARNLGIPNAVLTSELLQALAPLSGETVFYAVSPRGRVILKPAGSMTDEEQALFAVRGKRGEERIAVPTDKLDLNRVELLRLKSLRAMHSGVLAGPKAANLGQLSAMFPGRVTAGLVIPFGVYRRHLDQPMPETEGSYWDFLQGTFERAQRARTAGADEEEVEKVVLQRLGRLRAAIQAIQFLSEFTADLQHQFEQAFGSPLGEVSVFVRSDTNMEDLKDFTGAGLNLTVPNVVARAAIHQAIRDVWASPFTERSYRWRQKFLLNPENVYPSILLQKSLNLEKSGVMITTGLASDNPADLTVAFNRGVGGAVEGQRAETYLMRQNGVDVLLSPAREPLYTVLPDSGGVQQSWAHFDEPVLTAGDRAQLRQLGSEIKSRLPTAPGIGSAGPFDVEAGFRDATLWLFQARPFVENKKARASLYLRGLDPAIEPTAWIPLSQKTD